MKTRSRIAYQILGACLVLMLVGCSFQGTKQTVVRQTWLLHDIEVAQNPARLIAKTCKSLRVNVPDSAPGFSTSRMKYSEEPNQLDHFAFHQWVDTPARMLAASIQHRLDGSNIFATVVSGSPDVKTDYRIDSEISGPLQVFEHGESHVILTVRVKLIDVPNRTLLDSRTFSYSEPAIAANPQAGVSSANRAVQRFLDDLSLFVSASMDKVDCPA
jgi:cholesterol transport system auxiliary component